MSIKSKIGSIVILLTLVTAATVVTTYVAIEKQESYGAAINLSGKQRMLSQQMARLALSLIVIAPVQAGSDNPAASQLRNQLRESMRLFEHHLDLLGQGGITRHLHDQDIRLPLPGAEARAQLDKLRRTWEASRGRLEPLLKTRDAYGNEARMDMVAQINQQSVELLAEADRLTQVIEHDTHEKIGEIRRYQIAFLVIALGIAGLAWYFSRRAISQPLEMLASTVQGIRSGDLASRSAYSSGDEIGALARGINDMAASLEAQHLERLRSEAALRESEEHARSIFRLNPDATIIIDKLGSIHSFNPAAEKIFDYRSDEVIGRNVNMLMPEPYRSSHDGYLARYLLGHGGGVMNKGAVEVRGRRKDGGEFPLELAVTELRHNGQRHFLGSIRDISSRKEAELALERNLAELQKINQELQEAQQQLLQSEKMASIGQLAAGVAHEINNPIGYISSNIGTLKQYADDLLRLIEAYERAEPDIAGEETRRLLARLRQDIQLPYLIEDLPALIAESQEGVSRVRKIVRDLKDFSHVDEAEWQLADIHQGLDNTLNIVYNELKYKADIVKEYGELPPVECIISQLNQVFMNLLGNAAHAIENRGTITIRTGMPDPGHVRISICDTGKGIAREHLLKIFDPFFTTKPVGKGTGLGLSLSYGIVERHGGTIDVETEVGKGTTFTITLPVARPADEGGDDETSLSA